MSHKSTPVYQRILLKLSGEALQGDHLFGIDSAKLASIVQEVSDVIAKGVQLAIVIGGGNLIRGADLCAAGFNRISADQMGMLATVINGIALRDAFEAKSIPVLMMSALTMPSISEAANHKQANLALEQGKVVIFVAGTGNPLVTTDSAAALRGIEIDADVVFKATKVDGVYSQDPIKYPEAKRYEKLTYAEVVEKRLGVMDLNAILLCQDHDLPLRVFNMNKQGALLGIVLGDDIGTLISNHN